MSHEEKTREFCLHEEGLWYGAEELPKSHPKVKYHVIEYSAYETQAAQIKELVEALESIAAEKCSPSFDKVLPRLDRNKLISIIDTDTTIARETLEQIRTRLEGGSNE